MPSRSTCVLVACSLAVTACARTTDQVGDTVSSTRVSTTTPVAVTATSGPALPLTSDVECEDVPVAADYPPGVTPRAFRPCSAPTDLAVHVIRPGTGRAAEAGDTLIADYTGIRSVDGALFDTSYLRDVPLDFPLGRGGVIEGWDVGLIGAQAGSLIKLDIPADMAYGTAPPDDIIQPNDPLTFMIEVRAVIAPVSADDAPLDLAVPPSTGATALGTVDIVVGDGAVVERDDTAVVHMLLVRGDNQAVLFNTWERRDPLQVVVADGQGLAGLVQGLPGARVGGTRILTVPPDLAFGPDGDTDLGLPAGVDLIIVAEIVGVY
jgi:peptidylprolyl isomerase